MRNPKSDRIFKQIFLHHPDSLMHLLNSFLPLEAPIEALEYMPMELLSEYGSLQMTIVDVRCRDRQGRHFIVEMQLQKMPMFFRRVLTNACRIYSRQFRNGGSFAEVCPVYTLCLLDHEMFPDTEEWVHHIEPMVAGMRMLPMGELFFTFVEIKKWMKTATFDVRDKREAWMLFFTQPEKMKDIFTPEEQKEYRELWEAISVWDKTKYTEDQLWAMDAKWTAMMTHQSYVKYFREEGRQEGLQQGIEQGLEQGLKKGLQQGIQQGIQQGMEQGRQSGYEIGVESLLAAMQFLLQNPSTSDEQLMAAFSLSREAISRVRALIK